MLLEYTKLLNGPSPRLLRHLPPDYGKTRASVGEGPGVIEAVCFVAFVTSHPHHMQGDQPVSMCFY